jgi:hypothetical protein
MNMPLSTEIRCRFAPIFAGFDELKAVLTAAGVAAVIAGFTGIRYASSRPSLA